MTSAPSGRAPAGRDRWTVLEVLGWTSERFAKATLDSPRLDAEVLLAHVLGVERIQLYVQHERPLSPDEREAYRDLVRRRLRHEPVAYLTGEREFWSLPLTVRPGVLIPRPDTEVLVDAALELARRPGALPVARVAEVGVGSGAVALALATELPEARVVAGDIMPVPLEVARANAAALGLADRVTIVEARGLGPLLAATGAAPCDLLVSNPPYVREGDRAGLMPDVRDHEPGEALFAGADGLDVIRPLLEDAARGGLAPGGGVALEIADAAQADQVLALLRRHGFEGGDVRDDYAGTARVVTARRPAR